MSSKDYKQQIIDMIPFLERKDAMEVHAALMQALTPYKQYVNVNTQADGNVFYSYDAADINAVSRYGRIQEANRKELINRGRADDWLLASIAQHLFKKREIAREDSYELTKRDAFKAYQKKASAVMQFLNTHMDKAGCGARQRWQIALICVDSLANLLHKWNMYSVSNMLANVDKIPEALANDFPGYPLSVVFGRCKEIERVLNDHT